MSWDQEEEERLAWERLKAQFYRACPDQENWNVDDVHRFLYNRKTTTGISSTVCRFWRNTKGE